MSATVLKIKEKKFQERSRNRRSTFTHAKARGLICGIVQYFLRACMQ